MVLGAMRPLYTISGPEESLYLVHRPAQGQKGRGERLTSLTDRLVLVLDTKGQIGGNSYEFSCILLLFFVVFLSCISVNLYT